MLFFFNDTATPEIYTLSLHDALPISSAVGADDHRRRRAAGVGVPRARALGQFRHRTMKQYLELMRRIRDRKSTRLNSSHMSISYAVFCLKKKKKMKTIIENTNY